MFSGIAGGLVVAGLNGLIQRLKRASSGSDSTRQAQDQYMIDSWIDDQSSDRFYKASMRLPNTKGTDCSSEIGRWADVNSTSNCPRPPVQTRESEVPEAYRNQRRHTNPQPQYNEYFLLDEGIDRDVIASEICNYLGDDATCKPVKHEDILKTYALGSYQC